MNPQESIVSQDAEKVQKHSGHVLAAVDLLLRDLAQSGLRREEALIALKVARKIMRSAPG